MYLSFNCREYLYIPLKCNGKNRRRKSVTYIYIRRNYIFLHIVCTFIFYIFYGEVIVFIIIQYIVYIRLAKELLEVIYKKKELKKNL